MKTIADLLAEYGFFAPFPTAVQQTIAGCGKLVHFPQAAFLAREGEPADAFYLVRQGLVSLEFHTPDQGSRIVQTLRSGDVVGWSWLYPPYRWSCDVRARSELSVIAFDGKCLREKCERDHSLGFTLMREFARIMTQRLQDTRLQLLDIYGSSNHA